MGDVTITQEQRKKWEKEGKRLLDDNVVSGFNLEDFNRNAPKKNLYYAHSNKKHIGIIKKNIGGQTYPRESIYRWKTSWGKPSENTRLIDNKKYAHEKAQYVQTTDSEEKRKFLHQKALRRNAHYKGSIAKSWYVPDIRVFGVNKAPHYKKASLVTKNIDRNSRFATVITRKDKLAQIKRRLHGERVKTILIQDEKPKRKHSLFTFIESVYNTWK